jgi:hypothetical protein
VSASQPSAAFALQSAKPVLHVPIAHPLAPHVDAAFAKLQTIPHPPHAVAVSSVASHPSAAFPLQSPNPASQRTPHVLAPQTGVACAPVGHAVVHDPQAIGSDAMSRQLPLHAISPVPQEAWQVPIEQTWPAAQACAHAPQLAGSTWVSTQ